MRFVFFLITFLYVSASSALFPRDQVPQDPQDPVRARQEGAVRQGPASGSRAAGAARVSALREEQQPAPGAVRTGSMRRKATSLSGSTKSSWNFRKLFWSGYINLEQGGSQVSSRNRFIHGPLGSLCSPAQQGIPFLRARLCVLPLSQVWRQISRLSLCLWVLEIHFQRFHSNQGQLPTMESSSLPIVVSYLGNSGLAHSRDWVPSPDRPFYNLSASTPVD